MLWESIKPSVANELESSLQPWMMTSGFMNHLLCIWVDHRMAPSEFCVQYF